MYEAVVSGRWQTWARNRHCSPLEIAMAHGPMVNHDRFWGADFPSVKFSCSQAEHKQLTCNSLVLVKHTEESGSDQPICTTPYVGRAEVWMKHTPPWVMPDASEHEIEQQAQLIADVKWFEYKDVQPELYNCPVVSKRPYDYQDGNFEFCDSLEAVAVQALPYKGSNFPEQSSQQIICTDVAVFKRLINFATTG